MVSCEHPESGDAVMIDALARRLHAASGVLGRLAEKDGAINELMRLRRALERITSLGGEAGKLAMEALGW